MTGRFQCPCCGGGYAVSAADIGKSIVCPNSCRLVAVAADAVTFPTDSRAGDRRWVIPVVGVLILVGLGSGVGVYVSRDKTPVENEIGREVAGVAPPAADPTPRPAEMVNTPAPELEPVPGGAVPQPVLPAAAAAVMRPSPVVVPSVTPAPEKPKAAAAPKEVDARGFVVHALAKRIDTRGEDELLKDLLGVREVGLDVEPGRPSSTALFAYATQAAAAGAVYPGTLVLARGRPDLASLPFRVGTEAAAGRDAAAAMSALSKQLRTTIQSCIPNAAADPRPDPDKLFVSLASDKGGDFRGGKWRAAEAVPCIQQMLQAEGRDVRRMSVELLAGIADKSSTAALAQWAVYDTNAGNRAAAVHALRDRDRVHVAKLLLELVRFPWPRAVEHAAEALVALDLKDAVPTLAGFLALPDPDTGFAIEGDAEAGTFRREMVRANHARNCVMCHRPSFQAADLVRGAIPDPSKAIAPPVAPSYYENGQFFVSADTTYLRQDFSAVQPVPAPGPWPTYQRFDYMVSVRPAIAGDPVDRETSDYKAAVRFALKELTGADRGPDWAADREDVSAESVIGRAAQWMFAKTDPVPFLRLKLQEFDKPFLALTDAERTLFVAVLRRSAGTAATTYALIAYLDPLTRTGPTGDRERAAKFLAEARTPPPPKKAGKAGGKAVPD